ncbi:MAG: hypothetical protein AAFU49_18880 [Pseudomonadota bacterium]
MTDGFEKRFSQPGEAAVRHQLARLGWPTEPDPGGGPPEHAEADGPTTGLLDGWGFGPRSAAPA